MRAFLPASRLDHRSRLSIVNCFSPHGFALLPLVLEPAFASKSLIKYTRLRNAWAAQHRNSETAGQRGGLRICFPQSLFSRAAWAGNCWSSLPCRLGADTRRRRAASPRRTPAQLWPQSGFLERIWNANVPQEEPSWEKLFWDLHGKKYLDIPTLILHGISHVSHLFKGKLLKLFPINEGKQRDELVTGEETSLILSHVQLPSDSQNLGILRNTLF